MYGLEQEQNYQKNKDKTKVYLAGKITKGNAWRTEIIDAVRQTMRIMNCDQYSYIFGLKDQFVYWGPYFLSCDHGDFHGSSTHGITIANEPTYCLPEDAFDYNGDICLIKDGHTFPNKPLKKEDIIKTDLKLIEESDILFAWIDTNDCFGTLMEIGYAKALGKKVYIGFEQDFYSRSGQDFWFIAKSADRRCVSECSSHAFTIMTDFWFKNYF